MARNGRFAPAIVLAACILVVAVAPASVGALSRATTVIPRGCEPLTVTAPAGLPLAVGRDAVRCPSVGLNWIGGHDMISGPGGVWISGETGPIGAPTCAGVFRFDPKTLRRTGAVCLPNSDGIMAADARNIWVLGGTLEMVDRQDTNVFEISRIDRATARLVGTYPVAVTEPHSSDSHPRIAFGSGSVWLVLPNAQVLVRIRPDNGTVIAQIPLPDRPIAVAATQTRVWVADSAGQSHVLAVDTATNAIVATIDVGTINGPFARIQATTDKVWVGEYGLATIDPHTNTITARDRGIVSIITTYRGQAWTDGPNSIPPPGKRDHARPRLSRRGPSVRPNAGAVLDLNPFDYPLALAVDRSYVWALTQQVSKSGLSPMRLVRMRRI